MTSPTVHTVALVCVSPVYSGAERCLTVLVEELAGRYRFVALTSDRMDPELGERLAAAGAGVVPVRGLRRTPTPAAAYRLIRALRRIRPALVHVNATDQRDALAALVAASRADAPALATVHLVLPHRAAWRERLSAGALRRMDDVIAVSAASAEALRTRGVEAVVVRNGMPVVVQRSGARTELGLGAAGLVVGGIGRLDVQKGWDVLARAAPLVRREVPHVDFVVVGDGPERTALQSAGTELLFAGPRRDASALIGAFDLLAMPSRYEGLPLVAIEAMHAGVPVVASAVGGVAEVLGDAGVLVEPGDAEQLAQALVGLCRDPGLRDALRAAGRARAAEAFTPERMASETAAVYDRLIGSSGLAGST